MADKVGIELKDRLNGMELLFKKEEKVQDTVHLSVARYKENGFNPKGLDEGELRYIYTAPNSIASDKHLNLKFCISGNKYCPKSCAGCAIHEVRTVDILNIRFDPFYLKRLVANTKPTTKREQILAFKYPKSFSTKVPVSKMNRATMDSLLNENQYSGGLNNIFIHSKLSELLLYSLENVHDEEPETLICPFLAEANGLNSIYDARDILLESLDKPITIKELSRKVAINECYLKKGFKEVFGSTIFDFYQQKRMAHARFLLYEKGLTVTDVSNLLGYSSISHFSSAFKKFTGIKPCELLLRS